MKTIIAIAAAVIAATPAGAEPLAPKPVTEASTQEGQTAPAVRGQRICVVDSITGSRIQRRECRTREEWRARNVEIPANL